VTAPTPLVTPMGWMHTARFLTTAAQLHHLPAMETPEIAFVGRSNAGKSTCINTLTQQKQLAFASKKPGRTQHINLFALGKQGVTDAVLADLPGYGYAAVSKEKISTWTKLMHAYLRGRASLARVFVLVDGRHGLKPPDLEMFDLLDSSAMSYQIVLTKKDECKKSEVDMRIESVRTALLMRPAAHPEILFTSSETGEGIGELREGIARLMKERGTVF